MPIVDAGAGRRIANRDWPPSSDRFPLTDIDQQASADAGPELRERRREPIDRTGATYGPQTLERVPGVETRHAEHELLVYVRPFGAWSSDQWTGQHGVIGLRSGDRGQNAGGMQPWDGARRTLRSQPLVPWDAGTAIGPAGSVVVAGS